MNNTEEAYLSAFKGGAKDIFDRKTQPYANVIVLSAIRNVMLHRAGKADREFNSLVKRAPAMSLSSVANLNENDAIAVCGGMIKEAHDSVVTFASTLLSFVNAEMMKE